ncbi:hypothetical protein GCM10022282_20230 [Agromyces indicus]
MPVSTRAGFFASFATARTRGDLGFSSMRQVYGPQARPTAAPPSGAARASRAGGIRPETANGPASEGDAGPLRPEDEA